MHRAAAAVEAAAKTATVRATVASAALPQPFAIVEMVHNLDHLRGSQHAGSSLPLLLPLLLGQSSLPLLLPT
jgi:hypothetical protein